MKQPSRALIAEPPLLVLPSLAVAVGVNQAILLQQLHFLGLNRRPDRHGQRWVALGNADLLHTFPFWSRNTVWRMVWQLRDRALLTIREAPGEPHAYRLEYDAIDAVVAEVTLPRVGTDPAQDGHGTLPKVGSPTIKELSEGKSSKQQAGAKSESEQPPDLAPMTADWAPDHATREAIRGTGVPDTFVAEVLPEFRLYWLSQGTARPWGATFAAHVRRQWAHRPTPTAPRGGSNRPADTTSGRQPDARTVLAKSAPDPAKLATRETAEAAMAEVRRSLGRAPA